MAPKLIGNPFADPAFLALLNAPRVPQVGPPPYRRLSDFTEREQQELERFIQVGDFAPLELNGEAWISFENVCSYTSADLEPENFDPPFVWLRPTTHPEAAGR